MTVAGMDASEGTRRIRRIKSSGSNGARWIEKAASATMRPFSRAKFCEDRVGRRSYRRHSNRQDQPSHSNPRQEAYGSVAIIKARLPPDITELRWVVSRCAYFERSSCDDRANRHRQASCRDI